MLALFIKTLALVVIFDLFALAVLAFVAHTWKPFRVLCIMVASVCFAGFVAVAGS